MEVFVSTQKFRLNPQAKHFFKNEIYFIKKNEVLVTGVKGKPPTDTYKVSINYHKGYKGIGQLGKRRNSS